MKRADRKEERQDSDAEQSEDSLFDEKDALADAAPNASLPQASGSAIPMKRPSMDETANPPRKRQVKLMPPEFSATEGNSTKARVATRTNPSLSDLRFKKIPAAGPSSAPSNAPPPLPRRSGSASNSPGVSTPTLGSQSPVIGNAPFHSETCVPSAPLDMFLTHYSKVIRFLYPVAIYRYRTSLPDCLVQWLKLTSFWAVSCRLR